MIRVDRNGLVRVDETKSAAGRRAIPLPKFAVEMRRKRSGLPYLGEQEVIFPSTAGTLGTRTISPRSRVPRPSNLGFRR